MKSIWIAIVCCVLILLIGVSQASPVSNPSDVGAVVTSVVIPALPMTSISPYCKSLAQKVVTIEKSLLPYIGTYFNSQHFYIPLMVRWASWIWLPRRARRPYRNPLRAFRLNKKQRKRLRRRLSSLLSEESALPGAADQQAQEWV